MLYDKGIKETVLDVLYHRTSGIVNCIVNLAQEGFTPNKNKITILDWSSILVAAYENVDILTKEQQDNLDEIYNRVLKL